MVKIHRSIDSDTCSFVRLVVVVSLSLSRWETSHSKCSANHNRHACGKRISYRLWSVPRCERVVLAEYMTFLACSMFPFWAEMCNEIYSQHSTLIAVYNINNNVKTKCRSEVIKTLRDNIFNRKMCSESRWINDNHRYVCSAIFYFDKLFFFLFILFCWATKKPKKKQMHRRRRRRTVGI